MVPGSLGCGASVLAAIAILAPSRAARSAIASPMPREAPVMSRVLPASDIVFLHRHHGILRDGRNRRVGVHRESRRAAYGVTGISGRGARARCAYARAVGATF